LWLWPGFSVREVAATVERVAGQKLSIEEAPRRPGDMASVVANTGKLSKLLNWKPKHAGPGHDRDHGAELGTPAEDGRQRLRPRPALLNAR